MRCCAPTTPRALLRADDLCRLTPEGQAALVDFGVRTVVDLRGQRELALGRHPFAAMTGHDHLTYLNIPLLDGQSEEISAELERAPTVGDEYGIILLCHAAQIATVVRAIATAREGCVLVHCHAGKDRTGIVIGVLLAVAGVPPDTIAADYAASDLYLQPLYDEILANGPRDPIERQRLAARLTSLPRTMLTALSHLDRHHGGADTYLRASGVSDEELQRLRRRLCTR